jgi:hypothetical protein
MPRRSAAELAIGPIIPGQRPQAPEHLTKEEVEIWEQLTADLSAERFDCGFMLLSEFLVRHVRFARFLGEMVNRLLTGEDKRDDPKQRQQLRKLLTAHGHETQRLATMMVQLRLTPQSRSFKDSARLRPRSGLPPWQDWGDRARDRSDN